MKLKLLTLFLNIFALILLFQAATTLQNPPPAYAQYFCGECVSECQGCNTAPFPGCDGSCGFMDFCCGGGGENCGGGTCSNGVDTYTTYCTPNCDSADCHDAPACPGTALDCNIYGCPEEAHCGTRGCGTVNCEPGGNCVSNCTGCGDGGGGSVCGNGSLESGEACDNGPSNGVCPAICSTSCTINSCPPPPEKTPKACKSVLFTDQLTKVVIAPNSLIVTTPTNWEDALLAGTPVIATNFPPPYAITPLVNTYFITVPKLQLTVDFSKLGAIFAPPNSNYLESYFQDQTHRAANVQAFTPVQVNDYFGPGQKGAPIVVTDQLRVDYVVYIHGKPRTMEYDYQYTDIWGNDPKTIAEMWHLWGKPKPPSLGAPPVTPDPAPVIDPRFIESDCRLTHYPGGKIYQCNVGDSSSCSSNACLGVPWICNSDGTWSEAVPGGECTTECQDCRTTPWDSNWGRYWPKIPTAVNEFYWGILTLPTASGTKEIEAIKNGQCPEPRYRQIYFVMPAYHRTANITNQINQLIVPKAAQSSTAEFFTRTLAPKMAITTARSITTSLSEILRTIIKPISDFQLPEIFTKIKKTTFEHLNPINDVYAKETTLPKDFNTLPEQCPAPIAVQPSDLPGRGPFCSFQPFSEENELNKQGTAMREPAPSPIPGPAHWGYIATTPPTQPTQLRWFEFARNIISVSNFSSYIENEFCTNVDSPYKLDAGKEVICTFYQTFFKSNVPKGGGALPPIQPSCHVMNCSYTEDNPSCPSKLNIVTGHTTDPNCTGLNPPAPCKCEYEAACSTVACYPSTTLTVTPDDPKTPQNDSVEAGWDSCDRVPPPVDPEPSGPCTPGEPSVYRCGLGDNFGEGPPPPDPYTCDPAGKEARGEPIQCVGVPYACVSDGPGLLTYHWAIQNPKGECTTDCTTCYPARYSCKLTVNVYPTFYIPWLAPVWNNAIYSNNAGDDIKAVFGTSLPNTGETGQETGRPGVYTFFKPIATDPTIFPTLPDKNLPSRDQGGSNIKQRFFGDTDCNKQFSRDASLKPIALQQFLGIKPGCKI